MEKFEDLFNPSFLKETKSRAAIPADATVTMARAIAGVVEDLRRQRRS